MAVYGALRKVGAPRCAAMVRVLASRLAIMMLVSFLTPAEAQAPSAPTAVVDRTYFGLVLNRSEAGQTWPAVPFGSWRIWDAYVTWPYLEPERGHWEFGALDRMVDDAQVHDVEILLVLAHSPKWASARPSESSGYKPGFAAEPVRIEDWQDYVRTVATRYKGRIRQYQIWNEPSDKTHFSGTLAKLVELTCEAHRILKSVDPTIKVVSAGSAGGGRHIQYLDDFLAGGGAKCIDVVAHHFYVPRFGPEEMVPMIRQVRDVMRKRGVDSLPLWNTETGWWIGNTDGTPDHAIVAKGGWRKLDAHVEAGAVLERAFLLARAEGVERFYWYAWTNKYGWGLTDANGKPKPATEYWGRAVETMQGRQVVRCWPDAAAYACELGGRGQAARIVKWRDPTALVRREGPADGPTSLDVVPQ